MKSEVWYEGPEGCFEMECEDYFDEDGNERTTVFHCSHIRKVIVEVAS